MWTLAEVCRELFVTPRPVLCLDTCELLMAIQSLKDERLQYIRAIRKLLDTFLTNPKRVAICVTELVNLEWEQNREAVSVEAARYLESTDSRVRNIIDAAQILRIETDHVPPNHSGSPLIEQLNLLSDQLRRRAIPIQESSACVQRALDRVKTKSRPSHKGMIKDSIHLEHYLELARQLKAGNYTPRCIFVSGNKDDFWAPSGQKNYSSRPHPDLADEMRTAGLEFSGDLVSALGQAGLIL